MKKFLLWDHDGILVDTERWYFAATQECLANLDITLNQDTYLELMAQGHSCWELAKKIGRSDKAIAEAKNKRDKLYQNFLCMESIEIQDVVEVLQQLHKDYRMAVVSTARREDLELIHRNRNLLKFFEFVLTFEDCTHAKPHPAPYLEALRRFKAPAFQAIAIEDSSRGLQSAVSAEIDCIIVKTDFTMSQDFTNAWAIIPSISRLPHTLSAQQNTATVS
ncbi:MAG: HAD family phosphatase [Pseudomonadota bacterium]